MKKELLYLVILIIIYSFNGCSNLEKEKKDYFTSQGESYLKNNFKLQIISFTKIKGSNIYTSKKDLYILKYKATVVYTEGLKTHCLIKNSPNYKGTIIEIFKKDSTVKKVIDKEVCLFLPTPRDIGEKATIEGLIKFIKEGEKWRIFEHTEF